MQKLEFHDRLLQANQQDPASTRRLWVESARSDRLGGSRRLDPLRNFLVDRATHTGPGGGGTTAPAPTAIAMLMPARMAVADPKGGAARHQGARRASQGRRTEEADD